MSEESNSLSTFDIEVRQVVPQVVKEVICNGKNTYGQKERITFQIDPSIEYFDSQSTYITWDVECSSANADAPSYWIPNTLAGAGGGLVNLMTLRSGTDQVLEQISDYSVFHSMVHPHTCADSRQRALQDFSFGAALGSQVNEAWDLNKQPFYVNPVAITGERTAQKVKVCFRLYSGILNNYGVSSKVVPNALLGGLKLELETEDYKRALFPVATMANNARNDYYGQSSHHENANLPIVSVMARSVPTVVGVLPAAHVVSGQVLTFGLTTPGTGYVIADSVVCTAVGPSTGTDLTINIRTVNAGVITSAVVNHATLTGGKSYAVGDTFTVAGGNGDAIFTVASVVEGNGAVGTASQRVLFKAGDKVEIHGDLNGAGIAKLHERVIDRVAVDDATGEIVYVPTANFTVPADENLTDITLRRREDEVATGMTYTISNPKLVVRQCVLNPAQKTAYANGLKSQSGLNYQFISVNQYKKPVNKNELVAQMAIPSNCRQALAVVSMPQDAESLNKNEAYGWIKTGYTNEESYQYMVHQKLQPNRKIDVDGTENQPLQLIETTKAFSQSGVDIKRNKSRNVKWSSYCNSIFSGLAFKVGRALGEWSSSANISGDGDLSLIMNYGGVARTHDDLWNHYVFHKRTYNVNTQREQLVF